MKFLSLFLMLVVCWQLVAANGKGRGPIGKGPGVKKVLLKDEHGKLGVGLGKGPGIRGSGKLYGGPGKGNGLGDGYGKGGRGDGYGKGGRGDGIGPNNGLGGKKYG